MVILYYQRKNLQFNTITRIFDLLQNEKHRDARRCVFHAFEEFVKEEKPNFSLFEVIEDKVEIVRTDFDQIGVLIYGNVEEEDGKLKVRRFGQKGYIPKDIFFQAYAGSVVNSWISLKHFLNYQRKTKFSLRFMVFFEKLAEEADEFQATINNGSKTHMQKVQDENKETLEKWLKEIKETNYDAKR